MSHLILTEHIASIDELQKNPLATINGSLGEPLAVLKDNKPIFYCLSPHHYDAILDALDELHLVKLIKEREGQEEISVNINDL